MLRPGIVARPGKSGQIWKSPEIQTWANSGKVRKPTNAEVGNVRINTDTSRKFRIHTRLNLDKSRNMWKARVLETFTTVARAMRLNYFSKRRYWGATAIPAWRRDGLWGYWSDPTRLPTGLLSTSPMPNDWKNRRNTLRMMLQKIRPKISWARPRWRRVGDPAWTRPRIGAMGWGLWAQKPRRAQNISNILFLCPI